MTSNLYFSLLKIIVNNQTKEIYYIMITELVTHTESSSIVLHAVLSPSEYFLQVFSQVLLSY